MNEAGQLGLSAQYRRFLAAIEGQFGISVQIASNARVQVLDTQGRRVRGVSLQMEYSDNGALVRQTVEYDPDKPVNRTFPEGAPVTLTVSGSRLAATVQQVVHVRPGVREVFTLIVASKAGGQIIRRR